MKPSVELFDLIKSLTKSEKRFFKLTSSVQSGEKNYFLLFNYIDKQSEYDERALKEHFKGKTFINHLPSEKNHLYKLILKSLRQFYGDQTISSSLNIELKNIEILYNKALYKEAKKFLRRAKKMAELNEKFYFLIELIAWEKLLNEISYETGNFDVNLNKIIEEESEVIDKLRNLSEYHILYSRINAIFRRNAYVQNEEQRKAVEAISNYHLIKGKKTALSNRAASICYYIQGLCAVTNRDFDLSYDKFNRVRVILDKNPKLKTDLGERYVLTLFHIMHVYIHKKDYVKAQEIINEIALLKGKKGFNSIHLLQEINNILITDQIRLYNLQGKFNKSYKIYQKKYKEDKSLIENSNKEHRIKFYYNSAYALFALRDYKEALKQINLIINDNEQQLRQDIYSFSRILNLLIHFELENYDLIDYIGKSMIRFLSKKDKEYQIEEYLIKGIRKISKNATQLSSIQYFEEMREGVIKLFNEDKNESIIMEYINILAWIDSRLTGEDFMDLVQHPALTKI